MAINSPSRMHETLVLCLKRFCHPLQDRVIIMNACFSHTFSIWPNPFSGSKAPLSTFEMIECYGKSGWYSLRTWTIISIEQVFSPPFLRWNLPLWRGLPDSILDRGSNIQMTDCLRVGTSKSLRRPQSGVFTKLPLHELHAPSFQSPLSFASGFGPPLALYEWSIHAYSCQFSLSEWPITQNQLFGSYGLNVLTHRIFDQNWSNFVDTSEIWHC